MQVTDTEESKLLPKTCIGPQLNKDSAEVVWGGMPYKELVDHVEKIYDCMTVFKKNLFKLPSGGAGKEFVLELAFWTITITIILSHINGEHVVHLSVPSSQSESSLCDHQPCLQPLSRTYLA